MLHPIILSGGSGTRLWPLSRQLYPKQLLPLAEEATMLQATVQRTTLLEDTGLPLVICNEDHRFMVAEQTKRIGVDVDIMLEPVGRNTAPAVAVGAMWALRSDPDALLLVLPADHVIKDRDAFGAAVDAGRVAAEQGRLITFGIVPDRAHTGFGYIRKGSKLEAQSSKQELYAVDRFVEKPDLATAQEYVDSGEYLWNSGMFLFRADTYLKELDRLAAEMRVACEAALAEAEQDLDFIRLKREFFASCPADSIDYAVMEKTGKAAVVPLDAGWSDVGSWSALWEVGGPDEKGNVTKGDVLLHEVSGSYIHAENRLVAAVGVDGHVIVETRDAVLVADKSKVQDVKAIVNQLKAAGRGESSVHARVFRPWGDYECIDCGGRFQVKRITVKPGQVLSLQKHYHRAEHWIVVSGTAKITCGEDEVVLWEDQSTYIPLGTVHRLENPGKIPLELIEVQTGSYLGEDDIVRMEDVYGRTRN